MPPQNPSEEFGNVRKDSEAFRNIRNDSATFGNLRNVSERNENHTLSVREVARMFEDAGVARTERSIVNWCHPNKQGMSRLDCYFDTNENKYFITPQSVELAITEEQAKAKKDSETPIDLPHHQDRSQKQERRQSESDSENVSARAKTHEQEIMDLKITNRGKDYFIEQLQKERQMFAEERDGFIRKMMGYSRKVGELETRLLQLGEGAKPINLDDNLEHGGVSSFHNDDHIS